MLAGLLLSVNENTDGREFFFCYVVERSPQGKHF